jgi:hypothetical protein
MRRAWPTGDLSHQIQTLANLTNVVASCSTWTSFANNILHFFFLLLVSFFLISLSPLRAFFWLSWPSNGYYFSFPSVSL